MKIHLNLRSVDARLYLEFLKQSIIDYETWLEDIPAKDDNPEARRESWRTLRLLRKLRDQVTEQVEAS